MQLQEGFESVNMCARISSGTLSIGECMGVAFGPAFEASEERMITIQSVGLVSRDTTDYRQILTQTSSPISREILETKIIFGFEKPRNLELLSMVRPSTTLY